METPSARRRVLLIGWDAADWKTIMPLVNAGHMPAMASLLARGAAGNLATLDPPLSPMLWTSIATGKTADEHGVLGFVSPRAGGSAGPVLGTERRVRALWEIADAAGLRSAVVGWWPSHPADAVAGAVVSNFYQRSLNTPWSDAPLPEGTVHPPALADALAALRVHPAELTAAHLLPFIPALGSVDQDTDPRPAKLARIIADTASIHAAATYLLETTEWDFGAVYYDAPDHFGHGFMKYHPPKLPTVSDEDFETYRHVVEAGYRLHDLFLDHLLTIAGPDTTVVLVSDHGFHSDHLRPLAIPQIPAGPAIEHRAFGVFAAAGPGVISGARVYGAGLLDVTPTVLTLLGLPAADDMPGRVLAEILDPPPVAARIPTWEPETPRPRVLPGPADADEEAVAAEQEALRQLVALGYVDDSSKQDFARQAALDARYYLAKVLLSRGRPAEAADLLDALCAEAGLAFYGPWLVHARLHAGQTDAAEADLARVESVLGADDVALGLLQAEVALRRGRTDEAIGRLDALAAAAPADPERHLARARVLVEARRSADAEEACEAVLRLDPENARAYALRAELRLERGDAEGAAESALEAVGRLYGLTDAHLTLARAFEAL
ncbi:MAG TPA: alkaline phosphatase family protein, partial [Rubricoccaceae bacterium]